MIKGTITFFHSLRGFGFITTTEGHSYFFHISNFEKGTQPVLEGQVEFHIAPPVAVGKRPQAVLVHYPRKKTVDALDVLAGTAPTTTREDDKCPHTLGGGFQCSLLAKHSESHERDEVNPAVRH